MPEECYRPWLSALSGFRNAHIILKWLGRALYLQSSICFPEHTLILSKPSTHCWIAIHTNNIRIGKGKTKKHINLNIKKYKSKKNTPISNPKSLAGKYSSVNQHTSIQTSDIRNTFHTREAMFIPSKQSVKQLQRHI